MTTLRIPLALPSLGAAERRLVQQVLESGQLSRGPMVREFERAFAQAIGVRHAVALSSGSAALHLALLALQIGPGQEVITSPFTVPATANMIAATGAKVQFCDIEPATLGLDPDAVMDKLGATTAALLPVHVFGVPAPLNRLQKICQDQNLVLIEDACEALGSRYHGRAAGSVGRCGCFGFYPNKQLTTGEGGMLVTDDEELAAQVRLLRNHGRSMDGSWLDQAQLGWNYRLAELPAALGLGQITRLDEICARRAALYASYQQLLTGMSGVTLVTAPAYSRVSWFALVVRLNCPQQRTAVMAYLASKGIASSAYFAPLHLQPAWRAAGSSVGTFPVTEAVAASTLALPFFPTMTQAQIEEVCATLKAALTAADQQPSLCGPPKSH